MTVLVDTSAWIDVFDGLEALWTTAITEIAAVNYRALRRQGLTVRGTIDVIVATWCIENNAELIHHGRDLKLMEENPSLRSFT